MRTIVYLTALFISWGALAQTDKVQRDREAILEMEGCYKVTFDFAETFSPDTSYEYHENYSSWGIEYVFAVENKPEKIVLQHILVVNDTFIVKHWRQDWVYENQTLLAFQKDNTWKKKELSAEEARGTWSQKVYQVDDSPRYEGYGSWVHVDGKHYWEGTADAPLPRREFSKRDDYNVTVRHSRIELTDYGWILEQDNEKVVRTDKGDQLICWEKGHEKFLEGEYNCQPAIDWWDKNEAYWADVRELWSKTYEKYDVLKIEKKVDGKKLFERLFATGKKYAGDAYKQEDAREDIQTIIDAFVNTKKS